MTAQGSPEARVLIYDIETAPDVSYTFGPKWQTNVAKFQQPWFILSVAWKWLGESRVNVLGLDDFDDYDKDRTNDKNLVTEIANLFDEAVVAVTHNGVAFDGPRVSTRMLIHGLDPPAPYMNVDTCKVARRQFGFQSNSLKDLAGFLGLELKADAGGIDTWLECMAGDAKAWRKMKRYNKQDVVVLEELYLRLLPWIAKHPNLAAYEDKPEGCPRCGAEAGWTSRGWRWNSSTKRRLFQCKACGGYSLGRTLVKTASQYVTL